MLIAFAILFCCAGNPFAHTSASADDIDNFSCSGGTATGNLFSADLLTTSVPDPNNPNGPGITVTVGGTCTAAMGVIGRTLCYFKSTLGQILSSMYCTFQAKIIPALGAALTLFVVIFGILIITGMVRMTVKEAGLALFKIALVWTFATNASYGIGYGYKFFLEGAEEGAHIVSSALGSAGSASSSTVSAASADSTISNLLSNSAGMATNPSNGTASAGCSGSTSTGNTITLPFNDANGCPVTISSYCATWLAGGMGFLLLALPIATMFAGNIVLQYAFLYFRALLGYLTALVMITFLFILSPLFISFALFKVTNKLFQQWLKHLIAFSLQIIIIFAFLAMLQLVLAPLTTFFGQVLPLFKEYDVTLSKNTVVEPVHACSFCQYTITDNSAALANLPTTSTSGWTSPSSIACVGAAAGTTDAGGTGAATNGTTNAAATASAAAYVKAVTGENVIPITNLLQHGDLIMYLVTNALALWLIASVLQDFLKTAPELARQIGGLPFAASLVVEPGPTSDIGGIHFAALEPMENAIKSTGNFVMNNQWVQRGLTLAPIAWAMSARNAGAAPPTVARTTPATLPIGLDPDDR